MKKERENRGGGLGGLWRAALFDRDSCADC
jgi:hypothetical protein